MQVTLREVQDSDLEIFFLHQQDPAAVHMAAFTHENPSDRADFDAHWVKIRSKPGILNRTILVDDQVAGHVASFERDGDVEVTYWIGREFWGMGVATAALRQLLAIEPRRPINGAASKDNLGSLRVLEKCGFVPFREGRGFANARGMEIDEVVFRLEARGLRPGA